MYFSIIAHLSEQTSDCDEYNGDQADMSANETTSKEDSGELTYQDFDNYDNRFLFRQHY